MLDNTDLANAKDFFGGKGKALQHKYESCKGLSWVGIPIILAANVLHLYMQQTPFEIPKYSNENHIKKDLR